MFLPDVHPVISDRTFKSASCCNHSLKKIIDAALSIWHSRYMPKYIVKVGGGESSCRIVIPRKIIETLCWEEVEYVVVEYFRPHGIKIRRLFDDEENKT